MDFSYAGFAHNEVPIEIPLESAASIQASGLENDRTQDINAAIQAVAHLPSRKVITLGPGRFVVDSTDSIVLQNGCILRGSIGTDGIETILEVKGPPRAIIKFAGQSEKEQTYSKPVNILDSYVPVGSRTLNLPVNSIHEFKIGDEICIRRLATPQWIEKMGMDNLVRDGKKQTWMKPNTIMKRNSYHHRIRFKFRPNSISCPSDRFYRFDSHRRLSGKNEASIQCLYWRTTPVHS